MNSTLYDTPIFVSGTGFSARMMVMREYEYYYFFSSSHVTPECHPNRRLCRVKHSVGLTLSTVLMPALFKVNLSALSKTFVVMPSVIHKL